MIKLFQPYDKDFTSNGDKIIQPIKAKVKKQDNGEYYLDFEADLQYVNDLVSGNILVVPTPQGEQAFRINNPIKTRKKITFKAKHIFYDSMNYLIQDSYVVDKDCNGALEHLNNATDNESPFSTYSNIATIDSYRCVRTSLSEAVKTVLERWGGHLVRDNWDIKILSSIGQDNGVTVRYAKNLKEISVEENWDNVVTKILPTGKDGIMLNDLDKRVDPYLYAPISYDIPYTKHVGFEQNIDEELFKDSNGNTNETAYKSALIEDLRRQAQSYIETNCYPQVNYTLNANLDRITDVGDIVEVIDERLDVKIQTNIISFEYDCILGKYTQLEFGNFKKELSNLVQNITNSVTQAITINSNNQAAKFETELQSVTEQIKSVMGDGYVIYDGDRILVVDKLPKESAENVIRINNVGIGFSQSGINGDFTTIWSIAGTLDFQNINVINLTASLIKGGILKIGSNFNSNGLLEVYNDSNSLIGKIGADGLRMNGKDGSYIVINDVVGIAVYDRTNNKIAWIENGALYQKKSVVEQEIVLCNKVTCVPITITENDVVVNDGIAFVGG